MVLRQLNGIIDNNTPNNTTYIPGGFSPTQLINLSSLGIISQTLVVDCFWSLHNTFATVNEFGCVTRHQFTYSIDGSSNATLANENILYEYFDVNGWAQIGVSPSYTYSVDASNWSAGIQLIPNDPSYAVPQVLYFITIHSKT